MSPVSAMMFKNVAAGGGGGASAPDVIFGADLLMWLKHDVGVYDSLVGGSLCTTNLQEIGRWEDQSGNANHAVRASAINVGHLQYSTSTQYNGKNTVNFQGSGSAYLTIPNAVGSALSSAGSGSAFVFLQTSASVNAHGLWAIGTGGGELIKWTDNHTYEDFGSNTRYDCGIPSSAFNGNWRMYDCYSATNDWANFVDGSAFYSTGTNTVGFRTTGLRLGDDAGGATTTCWMTGLVVVKRKPTAGERASMFTYFTT